MSQTPAPSAREAREQAEAYNSTLAPRDLKLDDGSTIKIPPPPELGLFDDDAQAALEQLNFELESYDRHPDIYIPAQTVKDRAGNDMELPAETKPGALKTPYRKTNAEGVAELMAPPYAVQVARIALGETDYAKLRAGSVDGRRGSAADVWRIWNEQRVDIAGRRKTDPKSDGGAAVLEDVAQADRERPVEVPSPSDS